jgi:hypothetical protein
VELAAISRPKKEKKMIPTETASVKAMRLSRKIAIVSVRV